MFVGHGLLAFAVAATLARRRGIAAERALTVGVVAGAFATAPDVDVVYALWGLLGAVGGIGGPFDAADAFWATANVVHRSVTHSLVVGILAAVAAWLWRARATRFPPAIVAGISLAGFAGLVAVAGVLDGPVAASVMAVFVAAVLGVTVVAERWALDARTVLAAALLGLLSHPFGDLLTGEPPALLYPLDVAVLADRVALSPDPTLHLLGAFAAELAVVWVALLVALSLAGRRLRGHLSGRAALGVGYAGAALVLPAPTLGTSYHFVFSVLAVGIVGTIRVAPALREPVPERLGGRDRALERTKTWLRGAAGARLADPWTAVVTGLAAVTLAWLGYTTVYLLA